jgi:hypothetical protein
MSVRKARGSRVRHRAGILASSPRLASSGLTWHPLNSQQTAPIRTTRTLSSDVSLNEHHLRLAQYAATLTRLTKRIDRLRRSPDRLFGCHLRAALMAYDQTLLLAAHELGFDIGLEVATNTLLSSEDRLGFEAELALAGLRW